MGSSRRLALLVCLAIAAPAPVHAEPSLADLAQARDLRNQGRELRKNGDLRGALEKFQAAHALGQTAVTGIELARTYALLGDLVEAREVCLAIGRMPVAPDETHFSAEARDEAARMAEELRPRIASLTVKVRGGPAGVAPTVMVDRRVLPEGAVGEPRKMNPGTHEISARVGRGEEAKQTIQLGEGESREIEIEVRPPPIEPRPAPSASIAAPPASSSAQPPVIPPPKPRSRVLFYTGLGWAVGGGAIGTITGIIALSKASSLRDECSGTRCPPSAYGDLDTGRTMGTISTIAFGAAAVGGIVAIVAALDAPSRPTAARVSPWIGAGTLGVRGAF